MTREAESRSWDETTGNVWNKLVVCDHLLDTDSWKHGDPPQGQGISFTTDTRHLQILRRRVEEIMVTSVRHQGTHRIWRDITKDQWESLWSGETALRRYDAALWVAGHKTVNLLPDETAVPVRQTIEQYLKLVDWASLLTNKSPQENDQSWTSSTEFLT
jgi:hypothetical protein